MPPLNFRYRLPKCRDAGVYSITNLRNGKCYIGSSLSIRGRLLGHRSLLRRGEHENSYLQRSWSKYGEAAFRFDVLEVCEPRYLLVCEQHWIDAMDSADPRFGYNICPVAGSAMAGRHHSEETKARWSKLRKGTDTPKATEAVAKVNRGRKLSPEECAKRSAAMKGKPKSEAHKATIKATHWTKKPGAAAIIASTADKLRGRRLPEEHRRKITQGNLRRWRLNRANRPTSP